MSNLFLALIAREVLSSFQHPMASEMGFRIRHQFCTQWLQNYIIRVYCKLHLYFCKRQERHFCRSRHLLMINSYTYVKMYDYRPNRSAYALTAFPFIVLGITILEVMSRSIIPSYSASLNNRLTVCIIFATLPIFLPSNEFIICCMSK